MLEEEVSARFRQAMASFPSGVTIVTTIDSDGAWWGFTATSFCSLSIEPPLALVCLATSAQCHPVFSVAESWVIHIVPPRHRDLALRFSTKGIDKFAQGEFAPNSRGYPVLAGACAVLECDAFARYEGGDHSILVGRVADTHVYDEEPAIYFRREFHRISF